MFFINRMKTCFSSRSWKITFILYLILTSTFGRRKDRAGVSFVEENRVSIGYSQWRVVSPLNVHEVSDRFWSLEETRTTLADQIQRMQNVGSGRRNPNVYFWQVVMRNLAMWSDTAREKVKELGLFIGIDDVTDNRIKRSADDNLLLKIAEWFFGVKIDTQESKQVQKFVRRLQESSGPVNRTLKRMRNFKDQQLSINKGTSTELQEIQDSVVFLQNSLKALEGFVASQLEMKYLITKMKTEYQKLIKYVNNVVLGILEGSKGFPHTPFLSPKKVYEVLQEYGEKRDVPKGHFSDKEVLEVYDLVSVEVEKENGNIALMQNIRIPTHSTRATLYKISLYPLYDEKSGSITQIETDKKYIVIGDKSRYILLTQSEFNSCEQRHSMTLCPTGEKLWRNPDQKTCESAIYFKQYREANILCNYKRITKLEDKIIQVESGVFHYSLESLKKVPVTCTDQSKNQNLEIVGNGFLTLRPSCRAVIDHLQVKNLAIDMVKPFEKLPDNFEMKIESIKILKNEAFNNTVTGDLESLENDVIKQEFLDKNEEQMQDDHMTKLMEANKATLIAALKVAKGEQQKNLDQVKTLKETDSAKKHQFYAIIGFSVMSLVLAALAFLYLYIIWTKKKKLHKRIEQLRRLYNLVKNIQK